MAISITVAMAISITVGGNPLLLFCYMACYLKMGVFVKDDPTFPQKRPLLPQVRRFCYIDFHVIVHELTGCLRGR